MMNWEGHGRKRLWPMLKCYPSSSQNTEENHETPSPISGKGRGRKRSWLISR